MSSGNQETLRGWVIALACIAALVFAAVAFTEIRYVREHPYAYGPAKVIAYACGGGAVLGVAVALLARVVAFRDPR